jgi:signal peptidase I
VTAAAPLLVVALAVLLVLAGALVLARGRLVAVTVRGYSMSPTFMPGDRLLLLRGRRRVAAGRVAVVVAPHPEHGWRTPQGATPGPYDAPDGWYVKRVVAVAGEPVPRWAVRCPGTHVPPGMLVLLGEQPGSRDSKQLGYCPEDKLIGTVLLRLRAAAAQYT